MAKCGFCDEEVYGRYRCEKCNIIWNAGVEHGETNIKNKLRWMKNDFLELIK